MDVSNLAGKSALVTGAASGIGKETALVLARRGADLVICDLNSEGLEETANEIRSLGRSILSGRVDVANREEMGRFAARVHAEAGVPDILMNNAGVGLGGGFLHTSLDNWDWIIGINLMGVIHGCHFFVPKMVERGSGHVINVSSAAGYTAAEALAAYCTTKFAVLGLSEALRDELKPHGIGVTAICPGIINTAITRSSRIVGPDASQEMRQQMIEAYERRGYGPERVAANILKAVQRNRAVAPISPEAWGLYYLKRFAPGLLARLSRFATDRQRRLAGAGRPE
jgi:NAD(P)-dependent dehydrogenase (short-subunit alcohol dehydrogenase family)